MEELSRSIIKDQNLPASMDYELLRKEAIAITQQVSGNMWTDYNHHDPGVTILEQFCYAITDIAYRTNLNIETLLFHGGNPQKVLESNALYPAAEVFPSGPITPTDYRILILDHLPGKISNCWVETITDHKEGIQGLYNITLLLKSDVNIGEYERIKNAVRILFVSHRNLCEDLHDITILQPEKIGITAEIDIYQDGDAEEILAEILYVIESYFNPPVRFRTEEELLEKGRAADEIYDLPSFEHGFIDSDELMSKQKEFYISKIADHILNIEGVRGLRNLQVTQDGIPVYGDTITVDDHKYITLGLLRDEDEEERFKGFDITIFKGGIVNNYLKSIVIHELEIKEAKLNRSYSIKTKPATGAKSKVNTESLVSYESIQKSFPGIYGVGDYSPAKEDGVKRIAQSKQLKGYLMFFDQIMANHLIQLSKLAELFSIDNVNGKNVKTYFAQPLNKDVSGASELLAQKIPAKSLLQNRKEMLEASGILTEEERHELDVIKRQIKHKEEVVGKAVDSAFKSLIKLPEEKLKSSRRFEDRDIFKQLIKLKKLQAKTEPKDAEKHALKIEKAESKVRTSMTAEVEELEHDVPLGNQHLEELMRSFDNVHDRKNRILSHLLGRFGESFSTDFHLKFSSMMEGESRENITNKLMALKATFLKEIVNVNRYRAKAPNYLLKNAASEVIPLKRKVALLLDIDPKAEEGLTGSLSKSNLKVSQLTGSDVKSSSANKTKYIETKDRSDKVSFIINSSQYYTYLFKYGLKQANYTIKSEGKKFVGYFTPPTGEKPTKLFTADSKEEADSKVESLIGKLRGINAKSEGFHIIEHILLRPMDSTDSYFAISGKENEEMYKSVDAKPEDIQKKIAIDTILLGCYPTNYRILQSPKKEHVVVIKNSVGKELAKSEGFMTESGAQSFIDESVEYFNSVKDQGNLEEVIDLDNQKKYYFDVLDENSDLLLQSSHALSILEQEKQVENLAAFAYNPACYDTVENDDKSLSVVLSNYDEERIARSYDTFANLAEADKFIDYCLKYFESLSSTDAFKSIIRFRRMDGRNANDFNSQLSVVYSAWTSRFHNQEFLEIFKQTLFACAPAHLAINLVGLDVKEMKKFEKLHANYLDELAVASHENYGSLSKLSDDILGILMRKNQK